MHFTAVSKGDKIAFMITYIYIMGYSPTFQFFPKLVYFQFRKAL